MKRIKKCFIAGLVLLGLFSAFFAYLSLLSAPLPHQEEQSVSSEYIYDTYDANGTVSLIGYAKDTDFSGWVRVTKFNYPFITLEHISTKENRTYIMHKYPVLSKELHDGRSVYSLSLTSMKQPSQAEHP